MHTELGMTQYPDLVKQEAQRKHPTFRNWRTYSTVEITPEEYKRQKIGLARLKREDAKKKRRDKAPVYPPLLTPGKWYVFRYDY